VPDGGIGGKANGNDANGAAKDLPSLVRVGQSAGAVRAESDPVS
jgi:hypothetical protein